MAIQTVTMRNKLVDAYKAAAPYATLTSTVPGASAGTELPGITRQASTWGATATSAATAAPPAFAVASGQTVAGVQFMDAASAGTYLDGAGVTSQTFSSAGTYTVTATFTEA